MKQIRLVLADDHTIVRAGIRALLQNSPLFQVVGEAETGTDALRLARTHKPDVILMDITMPELNGVEATIRILKQFPRVRVIILSMHATKEYVLRALNAGAAGYLLKGAATAELEAAIKAVVRGETYLSSAVSRYVVDALKSGAHGGAEQKQGDTYEQLTPRQREVLQLIAEGKTTREIAERLNLSIKTVKTHRTVLMRTLNIHDIAGLVRYAVRAGLVSADQ
jgi:DNA-binding NarL/FixJ family response regulator